MNGLLAIAMTIVLGATTPGWENVCSSRTEVAPVKTLWTADLTANRAFRVELRHGAEGRVDFSDGALHIVKTNDRGEIVITAKDPFTYEKGKIVRMFADVKIADADVDYSSGFLRAYGAKENLSVCGAAERSSFWGGGEMTSRGMPCTAPGMTTRKYAQFLVGDDKLVTPALVVCGAPSDSSWQNWTFEDFDAAFESFGKFIDARSRLDHSKERVSDAELDAILRDDIDHTASVECRDGISRLIVDGEVVAPAVYHSRHISWRPGQYYEPFAGKPFEGSDVKIAVRHLGLANPNRAGAFWTKDGFDVTGAVDVVRKAMRLAPRTLFIVGMRLAPYPEFTAEHPEERWLDAEGNPVMGNVGSCISGYLAPKGGFNGDVWPWVSYSSRVWREAVKKCIREFTAELKRQGLSKHIVGAHILGFHDGQFSVPYTDTSAPAKAEIARILATGTCVSTNYDFLVKQTGFTAQEEFAREYKKGFGKPTIATLWCESPYNGAINGSLFFSSFCRSDALDIVVCQPNYRERLPAFPITCVVPTESFHLHGKMFWNEFDLRTYAAFGGGFYEKCGPGSLQSLGHSFDFPMWQTIYRKHAGEMDALRMGYWLYDMVGGWYEAPEIVEDIKALAREERLLALRKPSPWRPDMAVLIDDSGFFGKDEGIRGIVPTDDYIYAQQARYFVSSGVPFERYLIEDALGNPRLLAGKKTVVFVFMRRIDAKRKALMNRLSAQGTTLVFLSETGVLGGGEATRFTPVHVDGHFNHAVLAEPGVADNMLSGYATSLERNVLSLPRNWGPRCTVKEEPGVKVLARYTSDKLPAVAMRDDADGRRVYVCEPSGLTPGFLNRLMRDVGGYVATDRAGLQVNMNGDFISIHCLRPGKYDFTLPFACKVVNLKSKEKVSVVNRKMKLDLTAGETCRFLLKAL